MDCLAVMDSGNYAISLCRALERKGFIFEVVSIPCQIAKHGCGYCIKLPFEQKDLIIEEGKLNRIPVREIYTIEKHLTRNKYDRIY